MARPTNTSRERKILDKAIKRLKKCVDADLHNRTAAIEDLKFANGDQWDANEKKRRSDRGRPALQFNLLPKFIDQVVGDMLHNSPSIKVRPVDSRADMNVAKIRQGLIANIEYLSNAKGVYGYGGKQMVASGYGAWRVRTRYCEENPFVQEAYIEGVRNPFCVYLDPAATDQFSADAKYGFVIQKMAKDAFEEQYPDATWPSDTLQTGLGLGSEHWWDGELVTVAEYFSIEPKTVTMVQLEDGDVVSEEEYHDLLADWDERSADLERRMQVIAPAEPDPMQMGGQQPQMPQMPQMPPQGTPPGPPPQAQPASPTGAPGMQMPPTIIPPSPPAPVQMAEQVKHLGPRPVAVKRRETEQQVVRHRIITAFEILEGGLEGDVFPGEFVPIVLVKGKELNIEGKNHVYSLIRHAKDPQKMFNYWQGLSLDTPIPTPSGWTTMGELSSGAEVFGPDGARCRVLETSAVHTGRKCYRVTFDDGSSIVADDVHKWTVEERLSRVTKGFKYATRTLATPELVAGRHFIYATHPLVTDAAALPIHPYTLGVWLGDGAAVSGRVTICGDDLESIRANLEAAGETISSVKKDPGNSYVLRIAGLTTKLGAAGLISNKHIPTAYLRASFAQRLQLFQGLMDTDGSITKFFQCSFCSVTPGIVLGFAELSRTLGIKAVALPRAGRTTQFAHSGRDYVCDGQDFVQFSFTPPMEFPVFQVERKARVQAAKTAFHDRRTKRWGVRSIEEVSSVATKCIVVDHPTHLFLAGPSMVPTHNSSAAESIALAPKTPWLGTAKQFEGYEKDYATANIENFPYLKYNVDPEAAGLPQRVPPAPPPAAIFEQINRAEGVIKSVIGMFNADLGEPGSEQTGVAIQARQRPGDIATFEFMENWARGICYTGKILNSMIPEIYDTERDIRVRNTDETETFVPINTTLGTAVRQVTQKPEVYQGIDREKLLRLEEQEGPDARYNDITVGKYDVVVTTGPSYATQRQEASQHLMGLVQAAPQQMSTALDLVVRNLDFKDADELEDRLRKPLLLAGVVKPRVGEEPPMPPKPTPQIQAQVAEAQAKQQTAALRVEVEKLKLEEQKLRLQLEIAKAQADMRQASSDNTNGLLESDRQYRLDADRLALEKERLAHQKAVEQARLMLEAANVARGDGRNGS